MKNYLRVGLGFAAICGTFVGVAYANSDTELLLSAPIEQLDRTSDTVTVLGQKFHAQTSQLSVGEVVHVYGVLSKDGSIGNSVVQGTETYGANGDAVFVKGVVTGIDTLLGHAQVNGMTIDYTPELANPGFTGPSIGDVIAVAAAQPLSKGVLMAYATGNDAYSFNASTGASISVAASGLNSAAALTNGSASPNVAAAGTAGMNGGGMAAGMNGGGAAAKGMNGGGFAAKGMNGGGMIAAGMNGGGRMAAGMNGGGARAASAAGMNGGGR
jgi:hypothetical protein